jgi:transcriptional regulator PpsR
MSTPGPNALVGLDGRTAVAVASVVADIVVLVDGKGIVRDLKTNPETPIAKDAQSWMGRPWLETIAPDSQNKAIKLLSDAAIGSATTLREINHKGADPLSTIPMRYSAVKAKASGGVIVVGRDLSALAQVQQQLVQSQQAMERDYLRLRAAETRYRALFQMTSEPILIADMATRKVLEANPAAVNALATASGRLTGRTLGQLFDDKGAADIDALLSRAAGGQSAVTVRIASATTGRHFDATASLFRNEGATLVLIRLTEVVATGLPPGGTSGERYVSLINKLPDGFVVTDLEGHVVEANPAFLELAQLATADQAKGHQLGEWLGRAGIDVPTMTATLRDYGSLRNFATIMRGTFGLVESVEVSAVLVETAEFPCYGFVIRSTARPTAAANGTRTQVLPRSVDQFTELVGRVSLKELVRETTDIIERLCIEAALEMTQDNRATAAELLGLSRQSLYLKMRRFGIMDDAPAEMD